VFGRASTQRFVEVVPGVRQRTLATTPSLMLCEAIIERGAVIPAHSHVHEQITFIVEGRIRARIDGDVAELDAGDVYAIPGGCEHTMEALEASRVVDVFSPHRAEYALEAQ
jgi:quercetin dioxygenase-like cupin family protein